MYQAASALVNMRYDEIVDYLALAPGIQWLAPNAVRITRYARHLPPDRPWQSSVAERLMP